MKTSPVKLSMHENIARNLVLIDGVARSGKSMLTGTLPSLENMEIMHFYTLLEFIVPSMAFHKIETDAAKSIIRIHMNELAYNLKLSRGVNFRPGDHSGVAQYKDPAIYESRLARVDGDEVVKELKETHLMIPIQTHDMLVNYDCMEKLELDFRMVQIFRNPIDNAYSWWKRGWGERFGTDPRAFTVTLESCGESVPWYCYPDQAEWIKMNPMEKCIHSVVSLIERSVEQYKKAKDTSRIFITTFEAFAENTHEELQRICGFLNTRPSAHTPDFLKRSKCPRTLKKQGTLDKLEQFREHVGARLLDRLITLTESYENNLYGLGHPPTTLKNIISAKGEG